MFSRETMFRWTADAAQWFTGPARGLVNLLYPASCQACGAAPDDLPVSRQHDGIPICLACRAAMIDPARACPTCGGPLPEASGRSLACPRCRRHRNRFDALVRLGRYEGALRSAVLATKHASGEPLAAALGRLLATARGEEIARLSVDWIVPMPMHWTRRFGRGVNGPESIAWALGQTLSRPLSRRSLWRSRRTRSQADLSPAQRQLNVRRSFGARQSPALAGARLLLVDDVLTTGATANAATRELRRAGAAFVAVAVLARTPPD